MSATLVRGVSRVFRGFPRPVPGREGDPGAFGPGSMVWRVNGETATILGGGRALLMQIAHPLVAAGVADHSDFGADAFARLWRTLGSVLTVAFGDAESSRAAAEHVTEIHRGVVGSRDGREYRALDPSLLLWVHATLVDSALVTYERFVGQLAPGDRERYHKEMKAFAAAFLVPEEVVPPCLSDLEAYIADTLSGLEVSDEAQRLAEGILRPGAPAVLRPVEALLQAATIGLLPPSVREGFGLRWTSRRERALDALAWAVRRSLPLLPARVRRWPHALEAERRMR